MACASSSKTSLLRCCLFFLKNPASSLPKKNFNSVFGQPILSSNSIRASTMQSNASAKPWHPLPLRRSEGILGVSDVDVLG